MLRSAQICKRCIILGNIRTITEEEKKKTRQMILFFIYFLSSYCLWYSFLYLKNVKIHFHGILPLVHFGLQNTWILKIPFDSGNIHIKENKKPILVFSIQLRTKFVWSHGVKWSGDWPLKEKILNISGNLKSGSWHFLRLGLKTKNQI